MRGKPELDEPAEGDAATSISGWEVGHHSARRAPRPSRRVVTPRRSGSTSTLMLWSGSTRIANAAPHAPVLGGSVSPHGARAAPGRDARARSKRSALRPDAMIADAVGVEPSKQEARSVVYGATLPTNGT
jgi:hypothetical protein